jgi:N-acetylneuraminic acid mutarotase
MIFLKAVFRSLQAVATLLSLHLLSGFSLANVTPTVSLGERITCQTAIEEVYWRHRQWPPENGASKPGFEQVVPPDLIGQKAEDTILKSVALERFWGVTITGDQLQAELDRMAARTQSSDVLRELLAAVGSSPQMAAECLARPLIVDRLIRTYYDQDARFHGELKARAEAELKASSGNLQATSARYRELSLQRGRATPKAARNSSVVSLDAAMFDERVRQLRGLFSSPGTALPVGRVSGLREDESQFYAIVVLQHDNSHLRVATVEWPKVSFASWWQSVRAQLPMTLTLSAFPYSMPKVAGGICRDDSWKPTQSFLDPRYWHTAVWTGSEMIVFGGMSSVGTEYNDGGRYNPATDTWSLVSARGAPNVRTQHAAIWTGREMVVWGGTGDSTGGRYNPVTDTWRTTSTTGAPSFRFSPTAVWTGKEMLIWGGTGSSVFNTGARYNPNSDTWMAISNSGAPAARYLHTAVWTGTEMIVWGGWTGSRDFNDGGRYNPATNQWKPLSLSGTPSSRFAHTAVWSGREMIIWGGVTNPDDNSGGRYNPVSDTWKPTSTNNTPPVLTNHAAVWTGKVMIVWGGAGGPGFNSNSLGGVYNPASDTWKSTSMVDVPRGGDNLTAVWTGKEMLVWGGLNTQTDSAEFLNTGGRYNPATNSWRPTSTLNVPTGRGAHSGLWTGSEMIIWGGFTGVFPNTGGLYDPATDSWQPTSTTNAPSGRENAAAVWTGTEAIFWSGDPDGSNGAGTGGRYNPVKDTWVQTSTVNAPINRYGHTGVWTGTELIIFGGVIWDDQGWRYNPATDTWKTTSLMNGPGARDHHVAQWTGKEMIIWGGNLFSSSSPIGARYNPATDTWKSVASAGSPATRTNALSVWTGTEMIVWGGDGAGDGARYNPRSNLWAKTSTIGAPSPRVTQGVWTGSELLLWGGARDSSGARYNPVNDSWKQTTHLNAPVEPVLGRWSTVWTGSQMIIFGGIIETQKGSLYCASGQPNVAPVASNDSYVAAAGKMLVVGAKSSVLLNDSDGNGDLLTAVAATKPANGATRFYSNGAFTYKPKTGFKGADTFTYRSSDGLARSNTATVTITVQ